MYKFNGKMLLAMPQIKSRIFRNSVIYIHTDDETGSLGFMTNYQLKPEQAETWATEINWGWPEKMYHGGPVESNVGFVVHSSDYSTLDTTIVNSELGYTAGKGILTDLNRGTGPNLFSLVVGYCSWSPGQLSAEVENNDWRVTDYSLDYFFQDKPKFEAWEDSIEIDASNFVKHITKGLDNY